MDHICILTLVWTFEIPPHHVKKKAHIQVTPHICSIFFQFNPIAANDKLDKMNVRYNDMLDKITC